MMSAPAAAIWRNVGPFTEAYCGGSGRNSSVRFGWKADVRGIPFGLGVRSQNKPPLLA
jgi:hypothetical protein